MARSEKGHRSDEITAYLSDTLEPDERAAFEAHLATCQDCQQELSAQRALFDQVNKALAFKRKRSIDEQVARFEQEVATERAAASAKAAVKASGPARRSQRRWAVPAAMALAASAAAVFVVVGRPGGGAGPGTIAHQAGEDAGAEKGVVAAPHRPPRPEPFDAGPDGGANR